MLKYYTVEDYTSEYVPMVEEDEELIANFDKETEAQPSSTLEEGPKSLETSYKGIAVVLGGTALAFAIGGPVGLLVSAKMGAVASIGGFILGCFGTDYIDRVRT
jgi:hypothetical protein